MTTLNTSAPAPARRNTTPPPVPWRRLAWVSWRQYRAAAVGAAAFLGVLALYLLIMGLRIRGAYAAAAACSVSAPGQHCTGVFILLDNDYFVIAETSAAVLLAIPVLTGVFAGAPILARELDTGTFRFAWTQGAGRTRWTLARLTLPALTLTALAAAFSQLFGWFFYPWFAAREFAQASAFAPVYFTLTGIAFAAWTLAAFAIGALAGALIRRVVPAMAVAMAAWAGLLLATMLFLRRHYEAPLITSTGHTGASSWVISSWWTGPNGQRVTSENRIIALLNGGPHPGYTAWTIYQPATRYWHFQGIEGGWLLALSLLLVAATIWLVRRRAA
jgi:hypothetical protein